jgi:hypothetical protein
MGRLDEARDVVERLREITPLVIPGAEHWRIPEQREYYLEGLKPGLKERTSTEPRGRGRVRARMASDKVT